MTSIAIFPGHRAEDDDGWAQEHLRGHGHDVALALVHTSVGEDAHRVDALLLPDTALHALRWVEDLESALGTVVLIADPAPAGGDAALLGAAR
ncbi:hypothetical protein BJF86_08190 [Serinicoccus sp. CNJ-927]|uniref:hypothetical protein n=1 Tax=Serinicoccus sp. CNJ-927 TaxID=1904970 RepID=UPI000960C4EE|nr:hypothetical protein [Serinicoccus sp. CNJ-927]OLT39404.1 hypothetical protein BJF86_08190 [Serinicoccus sp. CNJ-927]